MILIRIVPLGTRGRVAIQAPYHKRFIEVAKTLPGLAWDKELRVWTGYADAADILTETLVAEGVAKVRPTVASLSVISDEDRNRHNDKLYGFQQVARDFLLTHSYEGALLADGLGLGKTRETLAAIDLLPKPALVVCPSIVKHSWVNEGKELGIDVFQLSGVKPPDTLKIEASDGIVCINYDILYAWENAFTGVKTIVFDEGHNLCNSKSRRSTVAKTIAHQADHRIITTGTPFPAKPIELWNVVDTLSAGRFGSFSRYGIRYAEGHQVEIEMKGEDIPKKVWNWQGTSHPEELRKRVYSFMLRRTREDVALELPEKTRQIIELDVGGEALPNMIPSDIDQEWMRFALSLAARGKMTHAVELTLGHLKEGSSVVVAAYRHEIANELEALFLKEGVEPFMATGEKTIPKRRQALLDAAKNQPCVTIVTTHAVGEGINELVFANVTIIVELDLSPRWIVQYEGRFHRQGQKRNVLYQYLIGMGSMDEIIRDRVLKKIKTFESIIGGMGESLSDDLAGSASEESLMAELIADIRELS